MENSRIFDKEIDTNLSEETNKIVFEYKSYLTSEQMNKKTNLLLYVVEKGENPYIYYLMIFPFLNIRYEKTAGTITITAVANIKPIKPNFIGNTKVITA